VDHLGLTPATRAEPLFNIGGFPTSAFSDFTVNGERLLPLIEAVSGEHFDVVTAITREFPRGAVEFLDDLLGDDDRWSAGSGAEPGAVPLYVCPVDYDILCGGITATIIRSADHVRLTSFAHTSTHEEYNERVTASLSGLEFAFARGEFDALLARTRTEYAESAKTWVRPDEQVGSIRRTARRARQWLRR
jgi:hypothetical protein